MSSLATAVLTPAKHLEGVAAEVALLAAEFVSLHVGSATAMATKTSPTDVVTHTDLAAEKLIRDELLLRCPGSAIVGEEMEDLAGGNGICWIVDPIDGTVNFLYDLPVISVSIAATIDGVVVAGAVADILRREVFTATAGEGCWLDGVPISVCAPADLDRALIGTGFGYDSALRAEQALVLDQLLPACRDIRCMGSAALNLCWVACGRLDAYFERNLEQYDYAAGALIAAEAGALVKSGNDNPQSLTMAAAPAIEADLRRLIGD